MIADEDPLDVLFKTLLKVWDRDDIEDINGFYVKQERASNSLEAFVRSIYFDIYGLLLSRIREGTRKRKLLNSDGAIIIMDGLSIREVSFIKSAIIRSGYDYDLDYGISEAPSDTTTFMESVYGVQSLAQRTSLEGRKVYHIKAGNVPQYMDRGDSVIVWLTFPDQLMHHSVGEVIPPKEAVEKTMMALSRVLKTLSPNKTIITSDHGYIYTKTAQLYWLPGEGDEKVLREVFKSRRGLRNEEVPGRLDYLRNMEPEYAYALFDDKGCYVLGRYFWRVQGPRTDVAHGGISLLETIVPFLTIEKR